MNPFIILLMVIVSTYNKSYLVETEDDKKSDPNIGAANDTNDYGQDYDVEIIPDIKLPPLPSKPQGNPEINPPGTQAQPGSNSPCSGNLEFGWAYPSKATMNNDLNRGATDKKNSPQECQAHCKTFPRCVGFTWVDGLNNCWIKHDMATHFRDNRGPGYISGRRNTCIGPAPWPLMSCGSKKKCEYETPPCPGTNDYGQDYDVEIIPDIKLPPLPQAQPGSNGPCIGLNNATGNATASRKACLKEKNTQYRGFKIQHQSGIDGSEEKCAHLCAGVSLCKFWSYRKRGKYCVIKSSISGRKLKKNWTSGPNKRSCVKGDPEFSSRPPPPPRAKGDPKFSSRPPPPPPAKACLKEKNTQYRGIKIQHQSGIDGSEEKCAHLCAGVSLCKFWSYRKRGKYCVIKSSISGRKFKKNWTSGPNKRSCVKGDPEFSSRPPPPPPVKGDPKFSSRPPPPPPAKGTYNNYVKEFGLL